MKKLFFFLAMIACGGQTIGDLDSGSGGNDASSGDDASTSKPCTKSTDCGGGDICGFANADGCSAKGQCFPGGPICNTFSPGCACDGTTINVACTGLPNGYSTAPLAHTGQCAVDAGLFTCGTTTCSPGTEICYSNAQTSTCMPANGCTNCQCAQSMFQCVSTCKQSGNDIYIQCQ